LDCNLPAPTNLQAVETGPTYAIMSWDAVPGAASYLVSWFNASGAQINSDTTLDTEFEVEGLVPGETYDFRVAAVCVSGEPSAIYAPVIVVPIVTELVISTDNPLGNLNLVCEKEIDPVAECTFDFNVATTYIGKIKVDELNRVYYFRVRYVNSESKGKNSKLLLDLIRPEFYPEPAVPRPGLFTENGEPSGLISDHGKATTNTYFKFFNIRLTKLFNNIYKINIQNTSPQNYSLEFLYYYKNQQPSFLNNDDSSITKLEARDLIQSKNLTIDKFEVQKIEIFNMLGEKVSGFILEEPFDSVQNHLSGLTQGIYVICFNFGSHFSSQKIIIN